MLIIDHPAVAVVVAVAVIAVVAVAVAVVAVIFVTAVVLLCMFGDLMGLLCAALFQGWACCTVSLDTISFLYDFLLAILLLTQLMMATG